MGDTLAEKAYMTANENSEKIIGIEQNIADNNEELANIMQEVTDLYTTVNILSNGLNQEVYGVSWDKSANPTLTRTHDAVGAVANVGIDTAIVQNDFDSAQIFGEITDEYDSYGNVFRRIPKHRIRKIDTPTALTKTISRKRIDNSYLPWCFWDFENNKELDYVLVGKYKASLGAGNKLESKPNVYPLINKNIVDFRTYARNNNVGEIQGYQQLDVHAVDMLQTLFTVEFATLNSQSIMQGYTAGQYTATHLATVAEENTNRIIVANAHADLYRVGQTISVGTSQGGNQIFYGRQITAINVYDASNKAISFDGAPVNIAIGNMLYNTGWKNGFSTGILASSGSIIANDGKYPCMYRGIESPWGDVWQFADGVNINERQAWVAKNAADYTSNVFADPYQQLGYANGSANGYVKAMGYDSNLPFAGLPVDSTGGSTTYYSDYYYQDVGQRVARFGGYWRGGADAGPWAWYLSSASSYAAVNLGGRLVKKAL